METTPDLNHLIDALRERYGEGAVHNLYQRLQEHYQPRSSHQVSLIGGGYLDTRTHAFHWNRYWRRYGG